MNHSLLRWCVAAILFTGLCISFRSPLSAADWPRFRGPDSSGISSDTKIPTEWDDKKNLKWKLQLPGKGFSSPIVVGKHVFVSCYSGTRSGMKRHLVCVDRQTGKIAWSKIVPSKTAAFRGPRFGTSHGHASHTPVSDGRRVYVLFGSAGVFAFDMKGKQLWHKDVGNKNAAMFGSAASPILYKDRLIVTAAAESETIRAFNKETGREMWKTETPGSRSYCTPMIATNADGGDELLISSPGKVWGMNPDTGKLKWSAETKVDLNACPSPLAKDGTVYVIGGRRGGRAAVRMGGKGDVTKTNVLWSMSGGAYVPSPILHEGRLYWVNDRGMAFCIDAKTGKELSRKQLDGKFYASAVLISGKLYVVSRFTGTFVLEATVTLKQVAHNRLSDTSDFSGSPAVSDGQLIFRSDTSLYCIEAK
jgi:hypothetical protein